MTSAPPPAPPPVDPPAAVYNPPPGSPVRPPLRRSRTDKVIGGVSGGLAEYSGIDALLWRVGFVALALAGPGVPVYLLLWLLMPADPTSRRPRAARPAEPRSPIPALTFAGLLIVVGLLAAVTRFTGWDVGPVGFFGSALLIVGLGLVALALTGGRRGKGGLIALGAVLSMGLLASTTQPWEDVEGGVGDRSYRPVTAAAVQDRYQGGVGDLEIDLTRIDLGTLDRPVVFAIDHGVGDVDVTVPGDADVFISGEGGIGNLEFEGETIDGNGALYPGSGSGNWVDDGRAEFRITITNGVGDVEVSRA